MVTGESQRYCFYKKFLNTDIVFWSYLFLSRFLSKFWHRHKGTRIQIPSAQELATTPITINGPLDQNEAKSFTLCGFFLFELKVHVIISSPLVPMFPMFLIMHIKFHLLLINRLIFFIHNFRSLKLKILTFVWWYSNLWFSWNFVSMKDI